MSALLFISGSHGLGHVTRDLEIAKELRRIRPNTQIDWLGDHPAIDVLKEQGERVLPEAEELDYGNAHVDSAGNGFKLNIGIHGFDLRKGQPENAEKIMASIARGHYDLVVGDETYDLFSALHKDISRKTWKMVAIGDFIGMEPMSWNLKDRLACRVFNKIWSESMMMYLDKTYAENYIMVGQPEDIMDIPFGRTGMTRRELAKRMMDFVGYIINFDPKDHLDPAAAKRRLGYGDAPLIVCTIGGTAVGRELLQLCSDAFPLLRRDSPRLKMVLVCGPRLPTNAIRAPEGVEVKGYVPRLYEHMAAADVVVTACGGTTTLELTALRRPFLYFPLEGHCEQINTVARRLERQGAGVMMRFPRTSPEALARAIRENIGRRADHPDIPLDGARKAALIMSQYLT